MTFDPLKEGAIEMFDPLGEGAVAIEEAPDIVEAEDRASEVWDMAVDLELPIPKANSMHDFAVADPKSIDDTGAHRPLTFDLPPEPSTLEKIKNWFIGKPEERRYLPPDASRMEKIDYAIKSIATVPLRTTLKLFKGIDFNVPDLGWAIVKKVTPESWWDKEAKKMNLDQAMDWAMGYDPSGFAQAIGEVAEFIGRVRTASGISTKLTGPMPKGATWLDKAMETGKVFGFAAVGEQISKGLAETIDEAEYGYGGAPSIATDIAVGFIFSAAISSAKGLWSKLKPTEQTTALKILGLKKGATIDEINRASRIKAKQFHPDKVKGLREEFEQVMRARAVLRDGPKRDIIYRDVKVHPKLLEGEAAKLAPIEAVAKPVKPKKPDIKILTDKALKELGKAERPREIIEAAKTKELGKRAARSAAAAERAQGEERLSAALGQLKGQLTEYKNPDFTPLKDTMPKKDIDALHDDVWVKPHSEDHFDKLNTAKAWSKVVEGFVPTRGEILLLEKQWGKEFAKGLLKKRPLGDRAWDAAADVSNFMRTMIAGGDVSVAGRQLRVLGQLYPKEFGEAVIKGIGAYRSEKLSEIMRREYEASEYHKEAKKYVQFFDPAGLEATPPSERPEWYMSHYPEQVPVLGHLIRMGNRNYVETMNHFTQSIWDRLRKQDVINGKEPTIAELKLRGKWLMSMSGRPEIGGVIGRRIAPITSGFFFAPRFAISRFTTPIYLRHLVSDDPVAREVGKNTAKAFASFIGTNIAILSLLKLGFGDDVEIELDPRSPDWGKIKIGNTRIDLWAGYQQAARFLVQMTLGQYKTQAGDIKESERLEIVGRFIRGKENPLVSLISDLYKGKTYEGDKPFAPPEGEMGKILDELGIPDLIQGVGKEAYRRMLFMWVQDFIEATVNDGWALGFTAGTLSFFGFNTSAYEDTAFTKIAKFKDNIAQTEHGKNWEELNSSQQKRLSRINKQLVTDLKLQAKIEGARRDDYDYVGRLIEDEKRAGKKVYKKLKPENQKLLDSVGISLGLSRKIGDWEIDDKRYKQYQEITAEILDVKLSKIASISGLADLPIKRRITKIELAVQISKDKAKAMVRREAKVGE